MMRLKMRQSDRGATLILVLIIITFVSLVTGAMLTLGSGNEKATVALRDQTADNYGANAAAQAALAQLKDASFDCSKGAVTANFGTGGSPFYRPTNTQGGPQNAVVKCAPDTNFGAQVTGGTSINAAAIPPALIAFGGSPSEGIQINGPEICVINGKAASNSIITASSGLDIGFNDNIDDQTCAPAHPIASGVTEALGTAGTNGHCTPTNQFVPTPCTDGSTVSLPTVPAPTGTISAANTDQAPICKTVSGKRYAALLPGLYTNVNLLNNPCSGSVTYEWFTPGSYFFNFTGQINISAAVIGGTPTVNSTRAATTAISGLSAASWTSATLTAAPLGNLAQATTFPGACANPVFTGAFKGVEFVFGSSATIMLNSSVDICATYVDANTIPVAMYGVSVAQWPSGLPLTGATIPVQSGCLATVGCAGSQNSLLNSPSPNGHLSFSIHGYTYAPAAAMILNYKNSDGQGFAWGLVARTFQIGGNGSGQNHTGVQPFVLVPSVQGTSYSIGYITVWMCAASATPCSTNSSPSIVVKFQKTGTGYKVLSWNNTRKPLAPN